MLSDKVHTLVVSSNRGRYACDDSEHGHDLTSGERCAILVGGRWIDGHIEHSGAYSTNVVPNSPTRGYYFVSDQGDRCGLCIGLQVRLYKE